MIIFAHYMGESGETGGKEKGKMGAIRVGRSKP